MCRSGSSCLTIETLPSSVLQKSTRWGLIWPALPPTRPASSKAPLTVASPTSSMTCVIRYKLVLPASSCKIGTAACRTVAESCASNKLFLFGLEPPPYHRRHMLWDTHWYCWLAHAKYGLLLGGLLLVTARHVTCLSNAVAVNIACHWCDNLHHDRSVHTDH